MNTTRESASPILKVGEAILESTAILLTPPFSFSTQILLRFATARFAAGESLFVIGFGIARTCLVSSRDLPSVIERDRVNLRVRNADLIAVELCNHIESSCVD
ncbi:unnamed protein product [Brassica oleracea var. botrytis]|uniref:(rape) hypothetical protein n=1 Tax=Brassica napus TaxID=3708 RepID=A0A816K1R1_BRANA|nr:unnamed protein product [Brassica napus]